MARKIFKTKTPVTLDGFQAIMKPSQYGYTLSAITDDLELINELEADREDCLKWAESKLKNPKRATLKHAPWDEVAEGKYKLTFSWDEDNEPTIIDSDQVPITNRSIPLYSGSTVRLAFRQKPYTAGDSYGTTFKNRLIAIQVISLSSSAGIDTGDMDTEDVANLFGKTKGFKADDPNVTPTIEASDLDADF